MRSFKRNIQIAVIFLSITSIDYLAAADYVSLSALRERDDSLCCPCPQACCGRGYISADVLYWRGFESGLDTCVPSVVTDVVTPTGTVISRFSGNDRDLNFKWNPGYRVGIGYETACKWDISTTWTHYNSHSNGFNNGTDVHWNIDFDVIDLIAGKEIDLGSCFSLKPFAGVRGARINQRLSINTSPSIVNSFTTIDINNKQNFWGIGPLIGLEADFEIGCGFSVYSSASISWLYGDIDVTLIDSEEAVNSSSLCNVNKNLSGSLAAADAALGIRWEKCFCNDNLLVLELGLEHHRYFDYNRIGGCGDLSFDGVNFSAGIEF